MMPCFPVGLDSPEPKIMSIDSFYVHCDGCGADGPPENNEDSARDLWNARITAALAEKDDGWIKCSERLPEHGTRVQIVHGDADGDPYICNATYNDNKYGPFIVDGGRKARNATHWRPLPPLPKGDE